MSEVLIVAALEFGPPMALFIGVKPNYLAFHLLSGAALPAGDRPPPEKDRECYDPADPGSDDQRDQMSKLVSKRCVNSGREDPKLSKIDH